MSPAVEADPPGNPHVLLRLTVPLYSSAFTQIRALMDRHTCDVNNTHPGFAEASKIPRSRRTAAAPAKFWTAANEAVVIPQATTEKAEYFAKGKYWHSLAAIGSKPR